MHYSRWLLTAAIALGATFAMAQPSTNTSPPAPAADVGQHIKAIQSAADPSAAIEAFSSGVAVDNRNVPLIEAYVRKMIDFRMPQMASRQAQQLLALEPNNGLAQAVMAYISAAKGQMQGAFADERLAVGAAPNDPFVIAVAAQLLAWYDVNASTPQAAPLKDLAVDLRKQVSGAKDFQTRYQEALTALQQGEANPPENQPYSQAPEYTNPSESNYYSYTYPQYNYYSDYPNYYPYDYSYGGWGGWGNWWWPGVGFGFTPFFFFSHGFDRDDFFFHHHDGDRDHHDRFGDRGQRDWNRNNLTDRSNLRGRTGMSTVNPRTGRTTAVSPRNGRGTTPQMGFRSLVAPRNQQGFRSAPAPRSGGSAIRSGGRSVRSGGSAVRGGGGVSRGGGGHGGGGHR